MWWYFVKLLEDGAKYRYAYGFESKKTTGEFEYDIATDEVKILKRAENHQASDFSDDCLSLTAYKLVKKYGAPEERMIAYG